jgi:hypothetical protein
MTRAHTRAVVTSGHPLQQAGWRRRLHPRPARAPVYTRRKRESLVKCTKPKAHAKQQTGRTSGDSRAYSASPPVGAHRQRAPSDLAHVRSGASSSVRVSARSRHRGWL